MKSFIGITGTTCVGKSDVAVCVAKKLNREIISADSMQIYVDMDIGTAKITKEQMGGVPHHMLDVVAPSYNFSSFEYQQMASKIIDKLALPPIVVGGTGFYFDSLIYPPEFNCGDTLRREQLKNLLGEKGLEYLVHYLRGIDEDTCNVIDVRNPVRVIRAIEIAESGQKRSQGRNKTIPQYDAKIFVLQRDRQSLYQQIDERVDLMIQQGLVEEVLALINKYGVCDTSAFKAIGYKEIIAYLQGVCSLDQAINDVKLNTRHYAKRQISYFKRMNIFEFIDVDGFTVEDIAGKICQKIQ